MQKLMLLMVMLCLGILKAHGTVTVHEHGQVQNQINYTDYANIKHWLEVSQGPIGSVHAMVGSEMHCPGSIVRYDQDTDHGVFFARAETNNNWRATGWGSWEDESNTSCEHKYKNGWAEISLGEDTTFNFQGVGISWDDGRSDTVIYRNTNSVFTMYKPFQIVDGCEGEVPGDDPTCGEEPVSPLIVDMAGDGFRFTNVDIDPVAFDIDNDGSWERSAWTEAGTDDAFIARDLNDNGVIDNGGELFGDATLLMDGSTADNGYEALKELDLPTLGGNGDGVLDRRDKAFRNLYLWVDLNHDGFSDETELWPMRKEKNAVLSLKYYFDPVIDEHGNILKYFGHASFGQGKTLYVVETTDVFFRIYDY